MKGNEGQFKDWTSSKYEKDDNIRSESKLNLNTEDLVEGKYYSSCINIHT